MYIFHSARHSLRCLSRGWAFMCLYACRRSWQGLVDISFFRIVFFISFCLSFRGPGGLTPPRGARPGVRGSRWHAAASAEPLWLFSFFSLSSSSSPSSSSSSVHSSSCILLLRGMKARENNPDQRALGASPSLSLSLSLSLSPARKSVWESCHLL